ncbi:hypothetical protein [Algoriphagus sp. CAU 1675]|uniref:hypothetical protein n=1 Tax=Algoriphagus sp. CAU 1675 TaxID=3032597 RepID=UPI0023DC71C2|nr:hypothetical protein [Algoriphagus sp. CAU 1675]MDF2158775.1 hypothetical protein [Algoriphagus sp. CAU 1675]
MKKILILFGLLFSILQNVQAQRIPLPGTQPIEISEINLKNPENYKKIFYAESAEKLIQAFGIPTSSEPYVFEMEEKIGSLYKYGSNNLYFKENKLYLFIIKANNIHVGRGNNYIKIGDPVNVLDTFYPNYSLENNKLRTELVVGSIIIDGSLIIKTNGSIITEIVMYMD